MPIGNNISTILHSRDEKIRQFARNVGISYTAAFALYHASTTSISFELLDKLCAYFNLTPSEIFPFTNQKDEASSVKLKT